MDYRERRYYAPSVYPAQITSRMGTTRVIEEKEADIRIIVKYYKIRKKGTFAL